MEVYTRTTTDHDEIREWITARGGAPAVCTSLRHGGGHPRIDWGDGSEPLKPISWKLFFELLEEDRLAFSYEEDIDRGEERSYYRFVPRDGSVFAASSTAPLAKPQYDLYSTE